MLYVILLGILGLIIIGVLNYNKRTVKKDTTVIIEDRNITVIWANHKITFEFSEKDGITHYHGAICDEPYSVSVSSYSLLDNLSWKLWAQCGDDEVTILTDLKCNYKIL